MFEGVAHELGAGGAAQLLLDVRAVGLDGPHAEEQLLGDLRVRVAERDEPQDVDLALGQPAGGGPLSGIVASRAPSDGLT